MSFKIVIKDIKAGRIYEVDVSPDDTGLKVKGAFQEQFNIPESAQRLLYRGNGPG